MIVHTAFDVLAALSAMAMTYAVYRWRLQDAMARLEQGGAGYAAALILGSALKAHCSASSVATSRACWSDLFTIRSAW